MLKKLEWILLILFLVACLLYGKVFWDYHREVAKIQQKYQQMRECIGWLEQDNLNASDAERGRSTSSALRDFRCLIKRFSGRIDYPLFKRK